MTPVEIKHAANAIWHLREHSDQIAERDAMREEIEATRSRRVEPMSAEEYQRRCKIDEQRELSKLMNCEKSIRSYANGSSIR